ncbi:hypothetical protein HO173_003483 [Letharia columbiana]|uniref:Zn(2)-C6 fungal-type domain-containing protein n=1 Tax=Letharia columbiana TaxID=112416 RepID=A0A8H6G0Z7_9LECA|nr:uncharacterized protein HO173_003483 [Letharia columbiana]KAF6238515.1 hypothetical protein HO173_003483 [Letharia columbiana]
MAPHGTGPTRKSHTKSRKGCRTCKRRHIRCDETFPQCKNCTKHNCRCDYMDHPPSEEAPRTLEEPNLLWTPRIESEIETWQRTGVFPFPEMDLQSSQHFRGLSPIDLRLIHHLSSIYRDMRLADFVQCTLWVQQIPSFFDAAFGYDFVMSSILALSATHIAWMTNSVETKNLAYFHRGVALKGLQGAIGNFSRDNSDAVLAASILLSWQGGWTSLMHGISTVINSMSSWKHISRFSMYIEDHPAFFSPHSMQGTSISFDDESLFLANNSLHRLSARLPNVHPLAQRLHEILNFAQDFQSCSTSMQSSQLFEKLQPLRARLFWMPVTLVKANDMGSSAMVLLAQLYTLALAIDSSIPELSGAALGSLTVHAIEQIDTKLRYNQAITVRAEMSVSDLDELMHLPRLTLARHQIAAQSRLGQSRREEAFVQSSTPPHSQHSPYSFQHSSMGSQPGTPDYPPPGYPSTPPMLPSHNFDDLSHPPSPFLHYGSPGSNPYSQSSPRPNSLSFDNRSLPGYEYSLRGDSPAYSPSSYSPGFIANSDEEAWAFGGHSPSFPEGDFRHDESPHKGKQPQMN